MNGSEHRQLGRDSLFLMAELRAEGSDEEHRIKVRNLSAGGMMGEGPAKVVRGMIAEVHLRNIGWVEGSVAWVQSNRFGLAFAEEIDPKLARASVATGGDDQLFRPSFNRGHQAAGSSGGRLRKI